MPPKVEVPVTVRVDAQMNHILIFFILYGKWFVKIIDRVKRLAKISLFESMSAWNVISTYRDQKFGRFTNPGQQFELVSSHAEGWVKGGDRHCPLLASKIFSP